MKKLTVIVNVNLEYTFEAKNRNDAIERAENVELPKEYVEDSFEILKVMNQKGETIN